MSTEDKAQKVVEPVAPMSPREAYEQGRAVTQKIHQYSYDTTGGYAVCNCGETFRAGDIAMHVEGLAEAEGQRRRTLYLEEHQNS